MNHYAAILNLEDAAIVCNMMTSLKRIFRAHWSAQSCLGTDRLNMQP